jgi:hypothetical protein
MRSVWQPIETAPLDGRHVLVVAGDPPPVVYEAFYETNESHPGWWQTNTHWTDAHDGQLWNVTLWQPLPAPPKIAKPSRPLKLDWIRGRSGEYVIQAERAIRGKRAVFLGIPGWEGPRRKTQSAAVFVDGSLPTAIRSRGRCRTRSTGTGRGRRSGSIRNSGRAAP